MTFTLRDYQEEVIEQVIKGEGKGLIALPLGAGKTLVAVEALKRLGAQRIAVTAPLNTHKGWERHFNLVMPELPVHYIGRDHGDGALDLLKAGEPGAYIVGWEYGRGFTRYKKDAEGKTLLDRRGRKVVDKVLREPLDWSKYPLDAAVFDEVHRGTNRKSTQTAIMHTARKVPIRLAISATPAGNRIEGIWGPLHFLWPDRYKYYGNFVKTFLKTEASKYATYRVGGREVPVQEVVGEKRPGIVAASIPVYARRTEEEVHGELPPVIVHDVPVELTKRQRSIYRQFEEEALAWLDDNPVAASLPITKMVRLRQVCLAVPTVNDNDEVDFKENATSSKLDAMVEILDDLPEAKAIVWTHSARIIPAALHRLKKAGYSAVSVRGGQSKKDRQAALDAFMDGDADVLVATITALGEGWDGGQNVCSTEIWLSQDDSVLANKQATGRLRRPGQKHSINRFVLRAEDTIETRQLGRLETNHNLLVDAGMM